MTIPFTSAPVVINDIPRFVPLDNYAESFGFQWNRFAQTQLDREAASVGASEDRLFNVTGWKPSELEEACILEAGSGAGRFSRVLLERTGCQLYSFDYSNAVEANQRSNGAIAPDRFRLSQASITAIPYPDDAFDKVLCIGVLQHTPDFEASVRALVAKTRPGGEIIVDFYPVNGWWTYVHAKYLLRPLSKRMDHDRLLDMIDRHADRLIGAYRFLTRAGLGRLTRFLPIADLDGTMPAGLTPRQLREWAVLDTFDMFSPEHDHPQRIEHVAAMMERSGARVDFAGTVAHASGRAAVVRATRR